MTAKLNETTSPGLASVPNRVLPKPVDRAELSRIIEELMAA